MTVLTAAPAATGARTPTPDARPARDAGPEVGHQRLLAVSDALLGPGAAPTGQPELLDALLASVVAEPAPDRVWLLLTALSGRFPSDDELRAARRTVELSDPITATLWLLDTSLAAADAAGTANWPLELVTGGVVVDVDYSATHDLHTGIQRVVRTTLPRWAATHQVVPVAWTPGHQALRRLSADEHDRVFHWGRPAAGPAPDDTAVSAALSELSEESTAPVAASPRLVVPWRSTVVLLEVPAREACERLASVGQWSGNRVVAVGYDCIPVVSAGLVPLVEPNRFVHYLTAVKHMSVVAGISVSATSEFRGFAQMLPGQGLQGPRVEECALPGEVYGPSRASAAPTPRASPLVLCVGSFEPRKNQLAVLWAAEMLWREGHRFSLRFVGGGGWGHEFPRAVRAARSAGRDVEVLTAISEQALDDVYRAARFTVFVSLHEGYGLPVAESLARGTPALVTGFGSTREIGEDGGVVFVDPRDDLQVLDGMRRLLGDDDLVAELRRQIERRPRRTWDDYADELWQLFDLPAADHA